MNHLRAGAADAGESEPMGRGDVLRGEPSCEGLDSAEQTRSRFDSEAAAGKYARSLGGTATHRREVACIRTALRGVAVGSRVLDLPSGTGRLLPLLVEMGFRVTEADSSPHMIEQARRYAQALRLTQEVEFRVEDAFATSFEDGAFEAILCNRLFHHFREGEVRRRCLRELGRICRGPMVVSFFCSASLGAMTFRLRNWLRRRTATDRIPIPREQFVADAEAAGLRVVRTLATRGWVSKQWYDVFENPGAEAAASVASSPLTSSERSRERPRFVIHSAAALMQGATTLSGEDLGEKVLELPGDRILKLFRNKHWLSSNTFSPYAKRFVRAAREMTRRGIATVDVLGLYRLPEISRHAVVYRKVPGQTLREALTRPGAAESLLTQLAEFLAVLHHRGVYFRSLHFSNLVCSASGLALIDLVDTTFWRRPLRVGLRARNFRHLVRYAVDRQALAAFGVDEFVRRYLNASGLSLQRQHRFVRCLVRVDDFFAGGGAVAFEPQLHASDLQARASGASAAGGSTDVR